MKGEFPVSRRKRFRHRSVTAGDVQFRKLRKQKRGNQSEKRRKKNQNGNQQIFPPSHEVARGLDSKRENQTQRESNPRMESAQFRMCGMKFAHLESAAEQGKHRLRMFMTANRLGAVPGSPAAADDLRCKKRIFAEFAHGEIAVAQHLFHLPCGKSVGEEKRRIALPRIDTRMFRITVLPLPRVERTGGMHDLASVTPGNVMSPEEVNKILQGIRRTEFNILGKENDGVKTAVIQQTDDPVPGSAVIETFAADAENIPSAIPRKNAGHVSG